MPSSLSSLRRELALGNDPARAAFYRSFFKCGPGQYGEGDAFRGGFTVPQLRALEKTYKALSLDDTAALLESEWHEDRLLALIHLVRLYAASASARLRAKIHALYVKAVGKGVNNWDLVDSSAPQLVGAHLAVLGDDSLLDRWARDENLWRRRVAMVATLHFIRAGDVAPALRVAALLLEDREDLMHKASGWMLREAGKRDVAALRGFLDAHAATMPRTMLRYALERLPEAERRSYRARKTGKA